MCNPVIEANNVWFRYEEDYILKNISLKMYRGELVIVIGPNGIGKSTLLKILAGIIKPEKGDVYICGYNTRDSNIGYLGKFIGYIHQNPWLYISNPRVLDEIIFTAKNFGIDDELINEYLIDISTKLDIIDILDRSPFTLSEGEARRVVIASALIHKPSILLMDEPTAGLDYALKKRFIEIIISLVKDTNIAVVIATHDIDILAMMPWAKLVVLNKNGIGYNGTIKDILKNPEILYIHGLATPIEILFLSQLGIDRSSFQNFDSLLIEFDKLRGIFCH